MWLYCIRAVRSLTWNWFICIFTALNHFNGSGTATESLAMKKKTKNSAKCIKSFEAVKKHGFWGKCKSSERISFLIAVKMLLAQNYNDVSAEIEYWGKCWRGKRKCLHPIPSVEASVPYEYSTPNSLTHWIENQAITRGHTMKSVCKSE